MFCKNCGKQIDADSKFCQYCGQNLIGTNASNIAVPNYTLNTNYNSIPTQPMINSYNSMPNNMVQQQNGNPILVMMIVVFLILAVAIPVVVLLVGGSEENTLEKESTKEEVETPKYPDIEQPNIEEPNTPSVDNGNTKTVNHDGYNYKIPSNYQHTIYDGYFAIYDSSEQWIVMIQITDYKYLDYKNNLSLIDAELKSNYTNVASTVKKYQNIEYIETNFIADGYSNRMIYTELDNGGTVLALLMPTSNSYSLDSLFKSIFPIITTLEPDNKQTM